MTIMTTPRTEHDPLCNTLHPALILPTICSSCELIAVVRADEQAKSRSVFRLA